MYGRTEYLAWAYERFGTVKYNLAKGGMRSVPPERIGRPESLHDSRAWHRLREHVAHFNGVSEAQALPALGTTHALWLALAALLEPGDEVVVEWPGYEPLWRIAQGLGARVVHFERRHDEGYRVSTERIAARFSERTRAVVLTSPHNPSGVRSTDDELRAIAQVCAHASVTLVVDEVYAPHGARLASDGIWGQTARSLAPNVVATGGLSKAYGLGALRVGWLLGDEEIVRRAEDAIESTLGEPPLAQAGLACHAFASLPELSLEAERQGMEHMCDAVARWVESQPGLSWTVPERSPFGFVRVEGGDDLAAAIDLGAREFGVLVAPGVYFGRPDCFRLGWSVARGELDDALSRLEQTLRLRHG